MAGTEKGHEESSEEGGDNVREEVDVETAEQLAILREENCDRVQGFYFSQAVPLAAISL